MAERSLLRDRAMFAAAIDSCLRGCDLVRMRVSDVMLSGEMRVQPMKTKQQVNSAIDFEPGRDAHKLLQRHIKTGDLLSTDYLFTSIRPPTGPRKPLSERVYLKLVKKWVAFAGLNPEVYGTHSIRRARPALIYRKTGNIRAATISAAVLRRTLSCMLRMHCRAADQPLEGRRRAQAPGAQLWKSENRGQDWRPDP
jgi:integrase